MTDYGEPTNEVVRFAWTDGELEFSVVLMKTDGAGEVRAITCSSTANLAVLCQSEAGHGECHS